MIFRGGTRVVAPLKNGAGQRMPFHFLGNRLGCFGHGFPAFRQIGIKKSEHVSVFDVARAFPFLQFADLFSKFFHFRPVHFRAEMMFGVITVVEKEPILDFAVAAHTPGNGLVRIRAVMPVIAI
jgi:hypothetical protein